MATLILVFGVCFVGTALALVLGDNSSAGRREGEPPVAERPAGAEQTSGLVNREPPREATGEAEEPEAEERELARVSVRRLEQRDAERKNAALGSGESRQEQERRRPPSFDAAALRGEIEGILAEHKGRFGVAVYDPESGQRIEVGGDESFFAASVGKLPAYLTLYRDAARGEVDLNEEISIQPEDVAAYGTGELYLYGVGHALPLRECARYLVNKSDNTAWAMLNRRLGFDRIQAELREIGATSTSYEEAAYQTTANDVLKMLEKIPDPGYTDGDLSQEMLDAMTNTAYEDRIPAALPEGTRVAHKIGTYNTFFHDAGIVYYKDEEGKEKRYYVVVMGGETVESEGVGAIREVARASHEAIAKEGR
jgi:beta-lactamase class A